MPGKNHGKQDAGRTILQHRLFLETYNLTEFEVPLLSYDITRLDAPFSLWASQPPLPPPPPPLPPIAPVATRLSNTDLIKMLNRNFQSTKEAETLERAGVLLRTSDSYDHPDRIWEVCPQTLHGRRFRCWNHTGRVPVTLVNRAHTTVYTAKNDRPPLVDGAHGGDMPVDGSGSPGMVVAPGAVKMLCSYWRDGNSWKKSCNPPDASAECVPGCGPWCKFEKDRGCSWRPEQLPQMISQLNHYNHGESESEIVLDAHTWQQNLPHSILAFYLVPPSVPDNDYHSNAERRTRYHYRLFLKTYNLTEVEVPLLSYDLTRLDAPFSLWASPPPLPPWPPRPPRPPYQPLLV